MSITSNSLHQRRGAGVSSNPSEAESAARGADSPKAKKAQAPATKPMDSAADASFVDTTMLRKQFSKGHAPAKPSLLEALNAPGAQTGKSAENASSPTANPSVKANSVRTPESSVPGSPYELSQLENGELRLTHKETGRAYRITIRPRKDLLADSAADAAKAIGGLLGLLNSLDPTPEQAGGIKSVSFSGNKGSVLYHNHPTGSEPIRFGGSDEMSLCNGVKGSDIRAHLKALEEALGFGGKVAVTIEEPTDTGEAVEEAAKRAAKQAESQAEEAQTARSEAAESNHVPVEDNAEAEAPEAKPAAKPKKTHQD